MSHKKQARMDDPIPSHIVGIKRDILKAALTCFNRDGYYGVSLADIGKTAGLSRQRMLYHYNDPANLLIELASFWADRGRIITLEHLARIRGNTAEDKIVGIGDSMFQWMEKYPELAQLTPVFLQARIKEPNVRRLFDSAMEVGRQRTADLLASDFPKLNATTLESTASKVHGLIMGFGLLVVTHGYWNQIPTYREACESGIKGILQSLRSK